MSPALTFAALSPLHPLYFLGETIYKLEHLGCFPLHLSLEGTRSLTQTSGLHDSTFAFSAVIKKKEEFGEYLTYWQNCF